MGAMTYSDYYSINQTTATEKLDFEIWAGFGIPIVLLGALSNAFFFTSVTLAMKKSKYGFEKEKWEWIILLNLAAIDFFYCTNYFLNGMIGIIAKYAKLQRGTIPVLCKIIVLSRSNLSAIDGWCLAVFAANVAFPRLGYVANVYFLKKLKLM